MVAMRQKGAEEGVEEEAGVEGDISPEQKMTNWVWSCLLRPR